MSEYTAPDNSERVAEPLPIDYRRIEVVDPQIAEILRGKTVAQRLRMMLDANETMRLLIAGRVQSENPSWNNETVNREVARRMLNEVCGKPQL